MVTGKASTAKAATGANSVFSYIASLPQPQRDIAERVDALAVKTLTGLQRSVKWGMSYYGVGDGWCFCCGGFAGHVKLMFVNGAVLKPVPPVTPVAMGKSTRGVELKSVDDLDVRQITAWMKQVPRPFPASGERSGRPKVGRKGPSHVEVGETLVRNVRELRIAPCNLGILPSLSNTAPLVTHRPPQRRPNQHGANQPGDRFGNMEDR